MDTDTFSDQRIIEYSNSNFISMKIDAELGQGIELAKKFNIRGYPTILFLNDKAEEIDRIIGYLNADLFLKEIKRIKSGKNTLPSLKNSSVLNPNEFSILYRLAKKYQNMNDISSSKEIIKQIIDGKIDSLKSAEFMFILFDANEKQEPDLLINFSNKNPNNSKAKDAIREAMYIVKRIGEDKKLEADLYVRLVNFDSNNNPELLNNFSWRMSELEYYLDMALEKIIIAIEQSEDEKVKYMYIDTKAEVLWKMGRIEEAIKEIKICRRFKPEDKYYKDQEDKFKKSI